MERGIATLELLIALGVLTVMLAGVVIISSGSQAVALDTNVATQALFHLKNALTEAGENVSAGNVPLATTTESIFEFETTTAPVTECVTKVAVTARWWQDRLRSQFRMLEALVADEMEFAALEDDCDTESLATSTWQSPHIAGTRTFSVGIIPRDLDIVRRGGSVYAFVTATNNSTTTPDVVALDVTDPATPTIVGSGDVGFPLTALDVAGDIAFAGSSSSTAQLIVLNVSDPAAPARILSANPLPDVGGSEPGADSVFYYDERVYVGTKRTLGNEFHIFDADLSGLLNDPPSHLGSIELNHSVRDITVRRDFAYLATSADLCELIVLDVSAPSAMTNPCPAGGGTENVFDASGDMDGRALFAGFGEVILGRDRAGVLGDVLVLDTTNPEAPLLRGLINVGLEFGNDRVSAVARRGDIVVMGTTDASRSIEFWDVSEPALPRRIGEPLSVGGDIVAMDIFENVLYALRASPQQALIVITPLP
jgi:type II secretory pathway pseudopilin PulG